jgi:hypothetical protein
MAIHIKQNKDYTKYEKKLFGFLHLNGIQRVVGTASIKEIKYASDYDLMEVVSFDRTIEMYECVYTLFKEKFKTAYKSKNIYIIDFKCGVLPGGKPIRWLRSDINKGHIIIEDVKYYFVNCLQQEGRIKMDIIGLIDGLFHEFSEIYIMSFGDFKTYNPVETKKKNIEIGLKKDIQEYSKEGNYFKALKRLFAYLKLSDKNPELSEELIHFFNSKTGELSSYKNDMELVSVMIEQKFKPVNVGIIIKNIKHIEQHINPAFKHLVKTILREKTKPKINTHTKKVEEILNAEVQKNTIEFIKSNKKIYSYINI